MVVGYRPNFAYSSAFRVVILSPRLLKLPVVIAGLVLSSLLCGLSVVPLKAAPPTEYEVKAAYLYNLAKFVAWPAQAAAAPDDSFPICVLGKDPFGQVLDAVLAGKSIAGKTVMAKRIAKPQDVDGCRIVFISSSEESRLKDILAALKQNAVLTVSDSPDFSRRGGMIQFVVDDNKIRFEVNLTNADDAGLMLSSELLKVAIAVRRNSAGD